MLTKSESNISARQVDKSGNILPLKSTVDVKSKTLIQANIFKPNHFT